MTHLLVQKLPLHLAQDFVHEEHRHHGRVAGHKISLAAFEGHRKPGGGWVYGHVGVVGVAIVGRPVARHLDDGRTLEVLRVACLPADDIPAARNACSALYAGAAREVRQRYPEVERLITYTLPSESGASLRGAGWEVEQTEAGGGSWDRRRRPRQDSAPTCRKVRWVRALRRAQGRGAA